jgi:serine/threonine protein phosphatase 1
VVVHGHTITEDLVVRPNRLGIDTGAYESGRLTALALQGEDRWTIQTACQDGTIVVSTHPITA